MSMRSPRARTTLPTGAERTLGRGTSRQRGAVLIVSLIMLVVMTLLGLAAINSSTINLKIINNMQTRQEAMSAAQMAVNQVLSSGGYFLDPSTAPTSIPVDINGNGTADYTVTLTQPCLLIARPIKNSELSYTNADDRQCLAASSGQNTGIMGQAAAGGGISECAQVTFRINATVHDTTFGTATNVQLVEGVWLRLDRVLAETYKNDATKRCS